MEMMTQLQSEQHIAKELTARLGRREDELKDLRDQVSSYGSCQLPWRYLLLFSSASFVTYLQISHKVKTCKNRRPYNLYCVGADVKPCSINQFHISFPSFSDCLTVCRPCFIGPEPEVLCTVNYTPPTTCRYLCRPLCGLLVDLQVMKS